MSKWVFMEVSALMLTSRGRQLKTRLEWIFPKNSPTLVAELGGCLLLVFRSLTQMNHYTSQTLSPAGIFPRHYARGSACLPALFNESAQFRFISESSKKRWIMQFCSRSDEEFWITTFEAYFEANCDVDCCRNAGESKDKTCCLPSLSPTPMFPFIHFCVHAAVIWLKPHGTGTFFCLFSLLAWHFDFGIATLSPPHDLGALSHPRPCLPKSGNEACRGSTSHRSSRLFYAAFFYNSTPLVFVRLYYFNSFL